MYNSNNFNHNPSGIFICDASLDRKSKLGQVVLPGGVAFFSDGRVVVICRNQDTVNFFSSEGVFIKAFKGGFSPMCLVINSRDELIVSDPGKKCLHVFNAAGEELYTVPSSGRGYAFRWPLYVCQQSSNTSSSEKDLLVCDCHAQTVVKFNPAHKYTYTYKLKTQCGNEVLRPHGIATNHEGDLFVIDTTMETVEVFTRNDTYIQTLINSEDGAPIKPKCLAISRDGLFIIGGRLGRVRVYQFLDENEMCGVEGVDRKWNTPMKHELKTPIKREYSSDYSDVKMTPSSSSSKLGSGRRRKSGCDDTPSKREMRAARRNVFKNDNVDDDDAVIIETKLPSSFQTEKVETDVKQIKPEVKEEVSIGDDQEGDDVIELNSNNSNGDVIVLE